MNGATQTVTAPRVRTASPSRRVEALLVALVLLGQVVFLASVAARIDPSGDERSFYLYGWRVLFQGRFDRDDARIFNSKLPANAIAVLPQYLGEKVKLWPFTRLAEEIGPVSAHHSQAAYYFWARLSVILFISGTGTVLYLWARRLYGPAVALIVLLLYVLTPTINGFNVLVSPDGLTVAAFLLAVHACRVCVLRPGGIRLLWAGTTLGLALLVKHSAVLLGPAVVLAWAMEKSPATLAAIQARRWRELAGKSARAAAMVATWAAVALLVLNAGFGFQGFGATVERIGPESAAMLWLPGPLKRLPLPVPEEFLNGLDQVIYDDQNAQGRGLIMFNGLMNRMGSAWYQPEALALKTPIPIILIFIAAAWLKWRRQSTPDDAWLVVPAVIIILNMCLRTTANTGVKYILPAMPFMFIFAGRAVSWAMRSIRPWPAMALAAATAWLVLADFTAFPNYQAYFNEIVPRNQTYFYLCQHDIDAGQARSLAKRWLAEQPDKVSFDSCGWLSGRVLVGAHALQGVDGEDCWRQLRESHRPSAVVADSYFLFDVDRREPRRWLAKESPTAGGAR